MIFRGSPGKFAEVPIEDFQRLANRGETDLLIPFQEHRYILLNPKHLLRTCRKVELAERTLNGFRRERSLRFS